LAPKLPATADVAGIRRIGGAHGDRSSTGLRDDRGLGGGGGGLGGGSGTGEGEDDYESADDVFHDWIPQKLYFSTVDFGGQIR
jgi:hypothetical protein